MTDLRFYFRLLSVSIRSQMQYRASFIVSALGQFVVTGVEAVGIWALFDRFGHLSDWTLPQVAFFYGLVNVAFAFADALSRGFDKFGNEFVKTGNFDRLLVRPRSSFLQLAGYEFTLYRVGRLLQGLIVFGWAVATLDIAWGLDRVIVLVLALGGCIALFMALVIVQATLSFWTTESLEIINTVTYGGVETAQYPLAVYREGFVRFFTWVVPLGCVTYFPGVYVMGVSDPLGSNTTFQCLSPLAGFAFFALAIQLFRFGTKKYTSTGS